MISSLHELPNFKIMFVLGGLALFLSFLATSGGKSTPTLIARPFLTPREQGMLDVLEQLLPGYRIHAQVAMGALLQAKAQPGRKASPADRNSFSQKIVDFVVQDRLTGRLVALIEIDDSSHKSKGMSAATK